jgi:hypothetical protein
VVLVAALLSCLDIENKNSLGGRSVHTTLSPVGDFPTTKHHHEWFVKMSNYSMKNQFGHPPTHHDRFFYLPLS